MIAYIIATLIAVYFAWAAEGLPEKKWLRAAAALPLMIVAAVRWDVGTDFGFLYLPQFTAVQWFRGGGGAELAEKLFGPLAHGLLARPLEGDMLQHAQMFWANFNLEEPGYRALMESIVYLGGGFRWFIALTAVATSAFVFLAVWKQSRSPALSVYFYVATSNYFLSLNIIRQYLAIAVVLFAVGYAVDRRFWRFAIGIGAACLFHRSALLVLPVWFLPRLKLNGWWGFAFVALALGMSGCVSPVMNAVLPRVGLEIYTKYFHTSHAADGFEYFFFAINLCFMLGGAWYNLTACRDSRYFKVWYWMTVVGTCFLAFSASVPLMKRINYYFAAPQFLMIPEMILSEKRPWLRRLMTAGAILAFAAETAVAVWMMNKNEALPYRMFPVEAG